MLEKTIYPQSDRPQTLQQEIIETLSQIECVHRIYSFGSLLGDEWDKWSDIDLIVVTRQQADFYVLLKALNNCKPIRHHHPLLHAQPNGHHLLGVVFEDESVFHCVDLNLFTVDEIQHTETLQRFGTIKLDYETSLRLEKQSESQEFSPQVLTEDEDRISAGIHFTKKNIKRIMRDNPNIDDLKTWSNYLRKTMADYPENYQVVGGDIEWVAHHYLKMADYLLAL